MDKDKFYSAKTLVETGLFPWRSRKTMIEKIIKYKKFFNPIIEDVGSRRMFSIKGGDAIEFLRLLKANKL